MIYKAYQLGMTHISDTYNNAGQVLILYVLFSSVHVVSLCQVDYS